MKLYVLLRFQNAVTLARNNILYSEKKFLVAIRNNKKMKIGPGPPCPLDANIYKYGTCLYTM